jgi:dTDP-4-dehydrorhamnose 3,5-epimerase-like enzyme
MTIQLVDLKCCGDERGSLIALESGLNVPFDIKRVYYIFATKKNVVRGFHAHKALTQMVVAVQGACTFLLDDGKTKQSIRLNSSAQGLLIHSFVWREIFDFSEDCVLMVLADALYDENDYIRNYDDFLKEVK